MGFELPDGKTARNIQDQVKFLTEKVKELIKRVNDLELHIEIVDELPDEGSPDTIYFVPREDPETGNYYEEYMWIDDAWELIGTTQIDLSNYCTLDTDQTITGIKTIKDRFQLTTSTDNHVFKFNADTNGNIFCYTDNVLKSVFGYDVQFVRVIPISNSTYDLGSETKAWKDLYLGGKSYFGGTNNYIYKDASNLTVIGTGGGDILRIGSSSSEISSNFRPQSNGLLDLGDSSHNWNLLHLSQNGSINFEGGGNVAKIEYISGGYIKIDHLAIGSYILPNLNNSIDLGLASKQWRNIYVAGNLTDGTNTVSVAQLAALAGKVWKHEVLLDDSSVLTILNNDQTSISSLSDSNLQSIFTSSLSFKRRPNNGIDVSVLSITGSGGYGVLHFIDEGGTFRNVSLSGATITSDTVSAY